MKNILDYNPTVIVPKFEERAYKMMVCIVQIALLTFFFSVRGGRRFIAMSFDILFSGMIPLQILALLVAIFVVSAYFMLWANLLWLILGKEEINIQPSSFLIKRSCILEKELKIDFYEIEHLRYFHSNVKSGMLRFTKCVPFHVGKVKVELHDGNTYQIGYDVSTSEFKEMNRSIHEFRKSQSAKELV